jgi:hypothetical protein
MILGPSQGEILPSPEHVILGQVACPITLGSTSLPHSPRTTADAPRRPLAPNTADAPRGPLAPNTADAPHLKTQNELPLVISLMIFVFTQCLNLEPHSLK